MKSKIKLSYTVVLMLPLLWACSSPNNLDQPEKVKNIDIGCSEELRICPDGVNTVARNPKNNCLFDSCP